MRVAARFVLATLLLCAVAMSVQAQSITYTLDPNHTDVVIQWDHFGLAHPHAMFNNVSGTLVFDPAHPTQASVEASIPVASVHTASAGLDEHLQAPDFFDAAKYPNITFKSTSVKAGAAKNKLMVTGNLSIHGVTKPVTLDVTINKVGERQGKPAVGFVASATLKRSDFGVSKYVPAVGDDIQVNLTTGAVAEPTAATEKPE